MEAIIPTIVELAAKHIDVLLTVLVGIVARKLEKGKMRKAWNAERERLANGTNGAHE